MHFNRIRNQFFGCRNVGRDSRSRFVGSDRPILHKNTHQNDQVQGNLFSSPTRKKIHGKIVDLNNAESISSNVNYSRKEALLYIFEDNEAVIKMIIKGRSPTMRHVYRTHRVALDWLFDRINLDPKIEIKYINTKNPTCRHSNQRKNSHVMNWIICCICSISVISVPFVVLKRCRKEHKKMQVKKESQQNQSRRWIWSHDPAWGIRTCLLRLHRKARWKTDLKVKYFWARGMSSNQERWDLWCALAHQTTQNGTLTTSGLLKSGTLVKRGQQEREDPWVDNSLPRTQTSLSSMTMIWTLTPPQNRAFRWSYGHSCKGRMIDCQIYWTIIQKMQCKTSTNVSVVNVYVFDSGSICIHVKGLLRQFALQKDREQSHVQTDVGHIWEVDSRTIRWDFWSVSNQLGRFMITIIFGQWWRSHQSLACKRFMYFRILCYVVERWIRTQHQILFGKNSWVGSKIHHTTELWTRLTESRWNESGIFPQGSPHCSSSAKSKSSWQKWATHHKSRDELFSGRCSMTSHGDIKTTKRNVLPIPHLCLCHSSDLDQK